ncbi:hypothetical protein GE09DRAFT_787836 [Coniochaeta sp. 2T2.1]|nr:hypothetical protein GE09DRAFT_787836 [Coniochaeta sp. 2T2.1]
MIERLGRGQCSTIFLIMILLELVGNALGNEDRTECDKGYCSQFEEDPVTVPKRHIVVPLPRTYDDCLLGQDQPRSTCSDAINNFPLELRLIIQQGNKHHQPSYQPTGVAAGNSRKEPSSSQTRSFWWLAI